MILVSTHDLPRAGALRTLFEQAGFEVDLVTPREAIDEREGVLLLVVTGGMDGPNALVEQARRALGVPVLAHAETGAIGEPAGIDEVFAPSTRADEVVLVGGRLAERTRLQELTGIIGETDAMREVLERVVQIAPVSSTVLVTGESGTGKELVARGLHLLSPRRHKPFIAVNVAALPDTLLESELFGHEKGAFTGAIDARKGLFELADGGTIFLDEIGEMPLSTQTKLLRVLEQREFLRVGGERPIRVDVRIVTATNQELRQLVALRDFRKDLYYRLNVLHIELPPLRERPADIPLLVKAFSTEVSERLGRPFSGISDEAMDILQAHIWPGNVRELRNLVESMVVMASGQRIQPRDIPAEIRSGGAARSGLLPATIPRAGSEVEGPSFRPQLEFVFRTLVDMRVDLDDLRRDFEAWRGTTHGAGAASGGELGFISDRHPPTLPQLPRVWDDDPGIHLDPAIDVDPEGRVQWSGEIDGPAGAAGGSSPPDGATGGSVGSLGRAGQPGPVAGGLDDGVVVYRPGMTMEDLEREAIRAALEAVGGNRRKAAELLEIGERTLYRKIKKFELDEG